MVTWDGVTRADVLRAIEEYDRLGLLGPWLRLYHDL